MTKKIFKRFVIPTSVFLITIFSYLPAIRAFFQQDEWYALGYYISLSKEGLISTLKEFLTPNIGHYIPVGQIAFFSAFSIFGINFRAYAILSILLHLTTVILIFLVSSKILKNSYLGILTALLFGTFASTFQATAWALVDIATHLSAIFGVIAFYLFLVFFESKKRTHLILSLVFSIVSLLSKENTLALLPAFLAFFFLFYRQKVSRAIPLIIAFVGLGYLLIRVSFFFLPREIVENVVVTETQTKAEIVYNILTFPFKVVPQTLVPSKILLAFSTFIATKFQSLAMVEEGTTTFDLFTLQNVFDPTTIVIFLVIFSFTIFFWKKNPKDYYLKVALFGLVWAMLNSLVYALSPGRTGRVFEIDSRNLYFPSIGIAIFLVSFIFKLARENIRNTFLFLSPLLIFNVYLLNKDLNTLAKVGTLRKSILTQIKTDYPDLPERVVFYTESDQSFYGLAPTERTFPFQSGFGHTLLVWYEDKESWPKEFYQDYFLWDITSQGYKEESSRGLGYFRDFELLAEKVKTFNIPENALIAYRYRSEGAKLEDMTQEVRGRIKGRQAESKILQNQELNVTASHNSKDASLAIDGLKETNWDSHIPYVYPQYFQINLDVRKEVVAIMIDSSDNVNQDKVGYGVYLSSDGSEWKRVFLSYRYPPDENGIVRLYFEPTLARFIKIEQVGEHNFASWVIHELKVYSSVQ